MLDGFAPVSVIIGPNNVGKSSILRGLSWLSQRLPNLGSKEIDEQFGPDELHQTSTLTSGAPHLAATFLVDGTDIARRYGEHEVGNNRDMFRYAVDGGCFKVTLSTVPHPTGRPGKVKLVARADLLPGEGMALRPPGGDYRAFALPAMQGALVQLRDWRSLRERPSSGDRDFITALHQHQGAKPDEFNKRRVFSEVQRLFRSLTGLADAELQPQADGSALSVEWRGRYLPISSMGAGLAHLLMVAFELARGEGKVLLIEEPELGLHPGLQRELFRFFRRFTDGAAGSNQVLLTTHSSVMLDEGQAPCVFHVSYDGDSSTVTRSDATPDLYRLLDDLDVRASDVLQANTAVWVEGPSDRIFLQRCFDLLQCELTEGRDYQFVCYGGALRTYLGTDESDPRLINILRLSRSVAIVADSDKVSDQSAVSKSVRRLQDQCEAANGHWWMTDGREIENYVSPAVLARTYRELLGDDSLPEISFGAFDRLEDALHEWIPAPRYGEQQWLRYAEAKPRVMRELMARMTIADLDRLALRSRLQRLIEFLTLHSPRVRLSAQ